MQAKGGYFTCESDWSHLRCNRRQATRSSCGTPIMSLIPRLATHVMLIPRVLTLAFVPAKMPCTCEQSGTSIATGTRAIDTAFHCGSAWQKCGGPAGGQAGDVTPKHCRGQCCEIADFTRHSVTGIYVAAAHNMVHLVPQQTNMHYPGPSMQQSNLRALRTRCSLHAQPEARG